MHVLRKVYDEWTWPRNVRKHPLKSATFTADFLSRTYRVPVISLQDQVDTRLPCNLKAELHLLYILSYK